MKILIAGGAGYIGSHMVKQLLHGGHDVVTLDDLSTGYRDAVLGGMFIQGSIADQELLDRMFAEHRFAAVFHFASFIQVGESVVQPARYYANNLVNTLSLLDAMVRHGVKHFVFSSSAAIFGEPHSIRIDEGHPVAPINPYGASKAMVEQVLRDYDRAYGLRSVSLRYFNACGASPDGELGERHNPETHLIPLALQAASGRRENLTIYGRNYGTPDGTCIRDYIHVCDLCDAHILALEYLQGGAASNAFNLGNGDGFSVQQVVDTVSRITGEIVPVIDGPRRMGDPARLVADAKKAHDTLGWKPRYADLDVIVSHAWTWEKRLSTGIWTGA
ncbi:MAG: UDP-glucose 4-epimerase GalE [Nitrosomonadales bacterium]|nr:UDP-glucose 4-epimerase GalE [Nitrosomonadales bacterium]